MDVIIDSRLTANLLWFRLAHANSQITQVAMSPGDIFVLKANANKCDCLVIRQPMVQAQR